MSPVKSLGYGVYQVELVPVDELFNSTGYIILGKEKNVIVETGASRSNSAIREALDDLNVPLSEIHAIVATHIHLDHSGGAGLLMEQCPNAVMYVHTKGMTHLVDPEVLIAGSKEVYGDMFDHYFNPVVPIPENRVCGMLDGDQLDIGGGRTLTFVDSPGHALHHLVVNDIESQGIFSGDAAGIFYKALENEFGVKVTLPSTTPTQFDPAAMRDTLDKLLSLKPKRIYFTHFGMAEPADMLLEEAKKWLELFASDCVTYYHDNPSVTALNDYLQDEVVKRLEARGVSENAKCYGNMKKDNLINAQGIIAYVKRLERQKAKEQQRNG